MLCSIIWDENELFIFELLKNLFLVLKIDVSFISELWFGRTKISIEIKNLNLVWGSLFFYLKSQKFIFKFYFKNINSKLKNIRVPNSILNNLWKCQAEQLFLIKSIFQDRIFFMSKSAFAYIIETAFAIYLSSL